MHCRYALVGCAVLLAACGSDSTAPATVSGSLSFSYTGAGSSGSASFNASGSVPANPQNSFGSNQWAAGSTATSGELDIAGAIPRSSTTWDIVAITMHGQTTGTFKIDSTCTQNCTDVGFVVGTNQSESSFSFVCTLTSGSVVVTSYSTTHATGTFSGSGACLTQTGGASAFTMTGGTFDVPLGVVTFQRGMIAFPGRLRE